MAHIQRKRGAWVVRWRDPDGTQRSRSCASATSARELARDVEHEVALGRRWQPRDARKIPRLREVAAAWLTARAVRLERRTLVRYGQCVESFVRWMEARHGANVGVDKLSRRTTEAYWQALTDPAQGRKVTTARKHLEAVELMWLWAADREEFEGLVPAPRRLELPAKAAAAPAIAPTWAEMDRAIAAAGPADWRRSLMIVLRCTGLRVAQAMGLRWEDLDEERGTLRVRPELGKSSSEKRGRIMPVAPVLLAELREPKLATWRRDEEWIVPSRGTGRGAGRRDPTVAAPRDCRTRDVRRMWVRAKVPSAVWGTQPHHAFRKGFISGLRAKGADPTAVEWLVGHKLVGEQEPYVDPWRALPLRKAVAAVPPIQLESRRRKRGNVAGDADAG